MATRINATDYKRSDLFFVNPFEVEVKEELRGRKYQPTEDDVKALAVSLLTYGQLQPVVARRDGDNRLLLTAGFTRCAAARLIRQGFSAHADGSDQEQEFKDEQFRLKVTVSDCNDETAFVRNVVENAQRKETSPIDDAFNQEHMRDRYGMSDADIARTYGYNNAVKVCRLKKLLRLDTSIQDRIHDGTMGVQGAIDILDLPESQREEAIAQATRESGRVNGQVIAAAVRDNSLADADDPFGPILNDDNRPASEAQEASEQDAPKTKVRNRREIVKFFVNFNEEFHLDPALARFCKDFVKYANGKTTDRALENALNRLLEAEVTEEDEENGNEAA